jgi:molybdopterin/thiamine biosynthesis adenylyltransferase
MITLRPKLHDLVGSAASRTVAQLHELGVEPSARQVSVGVSVPRSADPARWLLAETLVDMLLRLDPLIGEVIIDAPEQDASWVADLAHRLPLEESLGGAAPDYLIGIGASSSIDLTVDGAGWLASVGVTVENTDDGNPIGPLSAASLATAEAFKWAFGSMYPERALQLVPWSGIFSLATYDFGGASPAIEEVRLDATLIGLGGVGAGVIRAVAALKDRVAGSLVLVDADVLTTDNLNRVSYASLDAATAGTYKVDEAARVLRQRCPRLHVSAHPMTFEQYKQRTPRRQDRRYDVIITGLDADDIRWEVQRDLPRILIDGATGRDMNTRIERVEFGRYGCLGCSRHAPPPATDAAGENCDAPPDIRAPSLSFLSSFPGFLAAGELIKESLGDSQLRGSFDHIFRYGPNPDQRGMAGFRGDCTVGCRKASKLAQYRAKYPSEGSLQAIGVRDEHAIYRLAVERLEAGERSE